MSFFIGKPGSGGSNGSGSNEIQLDIFTATEGQKVFNLSGAYEQYKNRVIVLVGQVSQFSPANFTETSSTSITLTTGVKAGTEVIVRCFK